MQPAEFALPETSLESSSVIQVPRSTSEERPHNPRHSSPGSAAQVYERNAIITAEPATISSEAKTLETSVNSFAVIPGTLTNSQKMQYDVISIASTTQSHRSSLPHMMDPVDLALKYTGDSSTVPNDTPAPRPSTSAQTPKSLTILSSSPPLANNGMKVRGFSTASKAPVSPSTSISSTNLKRIRRRKTIASGETNPYRESLIDELSLVAVESLERPARMATSNSGREKNAKGVEQINTDELDEIGLPEERYRPRPSLRRSKSAGAQKVDADADLSFMKPRTKRIKSIKIAKDTSTPSQEVAVSDSNKTAAENPGLDDPVQELGISKHTEDEIVAKGIEAMNDNVSAGDAATRNEILPTAPTVTQPRRRGRPRKSETNIQKSTETPQPTISVNTANEVLETEPAIIREADNKQPSQDSPKIASWSQTADFVLAKTPTKTAVETSTSTHTPTPEAKRGPTEHSPLQCSKVSYRVGLSKKMRIAPLLKIIKK
jgi:hypothetical protein